jgi:chromosome segregation ATPase
MKLLAKGYSQRVTAATLMNSHSSRSHLLIYLGLHGFNPASGISKSSRLCLVDLAGSERTSRSGAEGNQLKEAQTINKSLSSVGDMLHALQHKAAHVPYRNSKLTFVLQDTLSGSAKVLSSVQVSPAETNAQESLRTLEFAARVAQISMGSVERSSETKHLLDKKKKKRTQEAQEVSNRMKEHNDRMSDQVKSAKESLKSAQDENHELQCKLNEVSSKLSVTEKKVMDLEAKVAALSRGEQEPRNELRLHNSKKKR